MALGGTSYAAFKLPKNSVGTKQIKNGAVTTKKIKNHAVTARKINTSGLTVPNANALGGKPGSAFAGAAQWALVRADGTIDSQSGGISMSFSGGGGYYMNFGRNVSGRPILVTLNYGNFSGTSYAAGQVTTAPCGGASTDPVRTTCTVTGTNNPNHVFISTNNQSGAAAARPFYIVIPG